MKKKIKIEDFLNLEKLGKKLEEYDFSDEQANNNYKQEDGIEKFFAYMIVRLKKWGKFNQKETNKFFIEASEKIKNKVPKYLGVIDPDSESLLLQEIYKVLWKEPCPNIIKSNGKFQGETLNSANTTLNQLYKIIEEKEENKIERSKRKTIKTKKGKSQPISIKFILSKYLVEYKYLDGCKDFTESKIIKEILENKNNVFEEFVKSYHTIGNFMPIPCECNGPRGTGVVKDYWDLTLLHIYNYYNERDYKGIEYMIGAEDVKNAKDYIVWLDSFGGKMLGWHNFIEKNYLQPFVKTKQENYYPKPLWKGHFDKKTSVLPENESQCLKYFENATKRIKARGKLMVQKLKDLT